MDKPLLAAAVLVVLLLLVHTILGEIVIIRPLVKQSDPPRVFGSPTLFTTTIRATWHIATVLGLGVAAILFHLATDAAARASHVFVLRVLLVTIVGSGLTSLVLTRGKHPSWLAFFGIAALVYASLP